jgi:tetratricopeptide (TPR) repeat protein
MSKAGPLKYRFCRRLGQSYYDLADYFDIKQRDRWEKGRECWNILEWLEERERLNELQGALEEIERQDLAAIAQEILSSINMEDTLYDKFQEAPDGIEWQDLSSIGMAGTPYNQGIVPYSPTPHESAAGIAQREAAYALTGLTSERHKRIDFARTLISQGQFNSAIQYLESLKLELWYQADNTLKYRLLANYGMAKLGLDEINDAAEKFVEALQYNSEDDRAIAYAAMGYVFQKDYPNAERLIEEALRKNPANGLAYSLRIRIAPATATIESVLERVPTGYHENPDVLVALGEAALNRKLYDKAEEWWQVALEGNNDRSMDSVKAFLAVALIEPVAENYLLIGAGQLLEHQKHHLERAVSLLDEVLGGDYVNPSDLSHLTFTALLNRASTLRLLGRYDEAIRDIEVARKKEPDNHYLVKQRALLAHEKGDEEGAYNYVSQILASSQTPEASLLAASSLMALNRNEEAERILDQFLQTASPGELKREAKRLKFDLFLDRGDHHNAEAVLQQVNNEDPESIFTFTQNIRWQKHIGEEENIPMLVEQAKAVPASKSSIPDQVFLADTLYSLNYFRDAAEVYEQFVDKSLNTPLSRRLLQAYYLAGNYREALNLCEQLLDKYGPLEVVSEMAAYIYDEIGDMNSVRQICEAYLKVFPEDVVMQLRLGAANYAIGEDEKLDEFLDSQPSIKGLNLVSLKKLAQLYKIRNRIDKFLEVIYEMRHRFYDNVQVHAFYQISYLEATKIQPGTQNFETVQDECGVLLRNDFGKEQWYVIEDRTDAVFAQHEINSSQSLYQALIGKNTEDEIVQAENSFGRNSLRITAITDKYFAAGKQSFSVLENQTEINSFRMITVPMDGDNLSPDWVQQFIEGLQQHKKQFDQIKVGYVSGELPFGAVTVLLNRNPIELWQVLAFGAEPFIHAWSNFQHEKFEDALINLKEGDLVVIDPISLVTLHYLAVADDVVRLLGKFGIAQSTIDLFNTLLETAQGFQREGFTTFGVEEGQGIFQEVSPEQINQQKKFFERILNWIRDNCQVLPCYRALEINKAERDKLTEHISPAFIDTVLIAGEPGRILYSDDQWLRWYARADSCVSGVWTQVVLKYCLVQQSSNETLYHKSALVLASRGYTYTIIDAEILMEAIKSTGWQLQPLYTSALKALANEKNENLNYVVSIAADFLRQLYLEVVMTDAQLIDPRDVLVFELMKILTTKRSVTVFVRELKKAIRQKFEVIPLQERDLLTAIEAWIKSQPIIR